MKFSKKNTVALFSYLLTIVFCIKSFREPDTWWQLRTGQWILENFSVPTTDVFSYTQLGKPWLNIKWAYEVLIAAWAGILGVESLAILQVIISCLIVYFLFRIVRVFRIQFSYVWFVGIIIFLMGTQFRMITRPEMFSHLFTVLYLYVLFHYFTNKSNYIYVLPVVQIFWCNVHEAFAIGNVILLIAFATSCISSFTANTKFDFKLLGLFVLSIVSIAVNPRGIKLFKSPLEIFSQVDKNKYTTELANIFSVEYWQFETYLLLILLIVVLLVYIKNKNWFKQNFSYNLIIFYGLLFLSFLYLAASAYRNIVFIYILLTPLVILSFQILFNTYFKQYNIFKKNTAYVVILFIILYFSVVTNKYYSWVKSRDTYGLQVLSVNNPVGATNYILQKNLKTQKCFADYLTSSYALFHLQPNFKTYIDLRDLDVFPTSFFAHYTKVINDPKVFLEEDRKHNFKYVMLYRNSNERLHHYLYNDSIYACVFVDPVCAIYEKTDTFSRGDIFQACNEVESNNFSKFISKLFNPLYNGYNYETLPYDLEASKFYLSVGKLSLSEKRLNTFLQYNPPNAVSDELLQKINEIKSKYLSK